MKIITQVQRKKYVEQVIKEKCVKCQIEFFKY